MASESEAPDSQEQTPDVVYFAQRAVTDYSKSKVRSRARDLRFRLLTVAGFSIFAALYFGARVPGKLLFRGFMILGVGVIIAFATRRFIEWKFPKRALRELPPLALSGWRLTCIGTPDSFSEFGPWEDVAFEPAVFSGRFAIRPVGTINWVYVLVFLATVAPMFYIVFVRQLFSLGGFIELSIGALVAEVAVIFLWPSYFRISPGRLEVLRYKAFSGRLRSIDVYDLRKAKVIADLRKNMVVIEGQTKAEFSIEPLLERRRFVYFLFLAALSSYEAKVLREDQLVG